MTGKAKSKSALLTALAGAALLCAAGANAQVYKWKDAKGVTHFSDNPPASVLKQSEVKASSGADAYPALPYELAQAVRNNPVTLYSSGGCAPCDQARNFLKQRGIPFTEKTVSSDDDQQKLKEAGSDGQVPLLLVGRHKLAGFESGAWKDALDAASYPSQSLLPRGYQFAKATPAAPPKPNTQDVAAAQAARREADAASEAEEKAKFAPRPPAKNGSKDFQF
jgi:glutaredoxin